MKVLILSCSTGGGHNSAARAVEETLIERGHQAEVVDPIRFSSEKNRDLVSNLYNNIIRLSPSVFGFIYQIGAIYDATPLPSPIYHLNAGYAPALYDYIRENNFDAVACTHLYGMEAMTAIKNTLDNQLPCYGIFTDYTCIPFMGDTKMDAYFIPHRELTDEIVSKGLPEDKLFPVGIPVSPKFTKTISKQSAREALYIPQDKKVIVGVFGSVGCGNITGLCKEVLQTTDENTLFYVIVGDNEKLKENLDKKFAKDGRIITISYTKEMYLYMKAADVLISKAGGLSSTEAAVANVPLVHLKSIPGCETRNAKFFASHGMSIQTKKVKDAAIFANEIICDEQKAEAMRVAQRETVNPRAVYDIVDYIVKE